MILANVSGEVRPELELRLTELADEGAQVEPLNPVYVVVDHQLVVVILEVDPIDDDSFVQMNNVNLKTVLCRGNVPVGLGEMLVYGEVVAEDTDAADLTGVPGP